MTLATKGDASQILQITAMSAHHATKTALPIARGDAVNFDLRGEYRPLPPWLEQLKRTREAAGLTLAKLSRRCGVDEPAHSRPDNGHNKNPTPDWLAFNQRLQYG